jgi:hypothetical protein
VRNTSLVLVVSSLVLAGCGGSKSSSPTTPSSPATPTPPVQQNRAPVIGSMNFAPGFGIAGLTQFSFNASASDPDGDAITYAWDVAGNAASGTNGTITFSNGGDGIAKVTVTDSKGLSASDTRTFVVGSMNGVWRVTTGQLIGATFNLTQSATGLVTGTFSLPGIGNGNTDPAQPGRIDGNANLTMRVKVAPFTDFNMTGTMASSGRTVSGSLQGSGFSGQPFTLTKQ